MINPLDGSNRPILEIFYILALPSWAPEDVTPFQGFAPGLIDQIPFLDFLPALPPDILDPTMEWENRMARRRGGEGAWMWTPVNLPTLVGKRKPTPIFPYMVIFSADADTARAVTRWRRGLRLQPIHVSHLRGHGAIHPGQFDLSVLRSHLIQLTKKAAKIDKTLDVGEHLAALNAWPPAEARPTSLLFHSHNVTRPNEMVLIGAGEAPASGKEGHLNASPHADYVAGIAQSAEAVMALWPALENRAASPMAPPRPDMFLIAPSVYQGMIKRIERIVDSPLLKMALRSLDRQRGYTMELRLEGEATEDDAVKRQLDIVRPLLALRGAEMKLTSAAIGARTAGTLAATIRLPPAVNRTGGVIGQLARFLRTHEDPPPVKSARVFKLVQDALVASIPPEHVELIAKSRTGVKIIADAPLEWLPIDGVPLGIRYDVSRINATPGNLFLEQIRSPMPAIIPPRAFRNYLVLSMFEEGDQIAAHLRLGATQARDGDGKPIIGRFASPKSPDAFVDAIRKFDGPMLIIDSHATHPEGLPGGLIIGGAPFDVWSLMGKVDMPPIVVLSACDTHPFDRSHATVANGFLACGAMAVVATALPIRAKQAARFIMRLITRAVHFGDIMNAQGRGVPWPHIVGGVLRMEFVTDIVRGFEAHGYFDREAGSAMLLATNLDLNPLAWDWFDKLKNRLFEACDIDRATWDAQLADLIASCDAIRYLHVGNPESIIIGDERVVARVFGQEGALADMAAMVPPPPYALPPAIKA